MPLSSGKNASARQPFGCIKPSRWRVGIDFSKANDKNQALVGVKPPHIFGLHFSMLAKYEELFDNISKRTNESY